MKKAVIIGGTKGLGLALAKVALERNIEPIIYGRSVNEQEVFEHFPPGVEKHHLDLCSNESIDNVNFGSDIDYYLWVAGIFLQAPLIKTTDHELSSLISLHFTGPYRLLRKFHIAQTRPYHLITIASCSSWKLREEQALYCALKAAKAAFTRNFIPELHKQLPGSKVTLINPGGLRTPNFWKEFDFPLEGFLDPVLVANIIWDTALNQKEVFKEMQILRKKEPGADLNPRVEVGPKLPETLELLAES